MLARAEGVRLDILMSILVVFAGYTREARCTVYLNSATSERLEAAPALSSFEPSADHKLNIKHISNYHEPSTAWEKAGSYPAPLVYHRAVFEGTTISLKCPRFKIPSDEISSHKQAEPPKVVQRDPQIEKLDTHGVRWFRNHVPLLNANHFKQASSSAHLKFPGARSRVGKETAATVDEMDYTTTRTVSEITELTWKTRPSPEVRTSAQPRVESALTEDSGELGALVTSENVNELTGVRKRINALESSHTPETSLYINSIGELIINRVPRNLAGKYTCLSEGLQCEIVLDVLADSLSRDLTTSEVRYADEKSNGKRSRDVRTQGSQGSYDPEVIVEPRGKDRLAINSPESNNDKALKDRTYERHTPDSYDDLAQKRMSSDLLIFNRPSLTERSELVTSSGKVNPPAGGNIYTSTTTDIRQPLLQADGIRTLDDMGHFIEDNDQQRTLTDTATSGFNRTTTSSSFLNRAPGLQGSYPSLFNLHWQQYRQIHKINVEIIKVDDVKVVPGLLYTKQQLYCPIGLNRMKSKLISALIQNLCEASQLEDDPTSAEIRNRTECNRLTEGLLLQIMGRNCSRSYSDVGSRLVEEADTHHPGNSSISESKGKKFHQDYNLSNCFDSIFELNWFKDGTKLEFSPEGKGTDSRLNVKLINWLNQSSVDLIDNSHGETSSDAFYNVSPNVPMTSTQHEGHSRPTSFQIGDIERVKKDITEREVVTDRAGRNFAIARSRVLEIDGITKENSGRYTCALELSMPKLQHRIRDYKQHIGADNLIRVNISGQFRMSNSSYNDLKYQRDNHETPSQRYPDVHRRERSEDDQCTDKSCTNQSAYRETNLFQGEQQNNTTQLEHQHSNSTVPVELDDESVIDTLLEIIKRKMSAPTIGPIAIQTFALVVSERPANSCDVWTTIRTASNAFTRRRLVEFRRLKWSQQQQRPQQLLKLDEHQQLLRNKRSTLESGPSELSAQHEWSQTQATSPIPTTKGASLAWDMNGNEPDDEPTAESRFVSRLAYLMSTGSPTGRQHYSNGAPDPSASTGRFRLATSDLSSQHIKALAEDKSLRAIYLDRLQRLKDQSLVNNSNGLIDQDTTSTSTLDEPFNHANEGVKSKFYSQEESPTNTYAPSTTETENPLVASLSSSSRLHISSHNVDEGHLGLSGQEKSSDEDTVRAELINHGVRLNSQGVFVIDDDTAQQEYLLTSNTDQQSKIVTRTLNKLNQPTFGHHRASESLESTNRTRVRTDPARKGSTKTDEHFLTYIVQPQGTSTDKPNRLVIDSSSNIINEMTKTPPVSDKTEMSPRAGLSFPREISDQDDVTDLSHSYETRPLLTSNYDLDLDESLMWTANQYLYIHMRAIAASSMFGAEVDVEWSNERSNGSSSIPKAARKLDPRESDSDSYNNVDRRDRSDRYHNSAPFATIDVISDRNLLLQCTAHALGRVPDINWYKRIERIPKHYKGRVHLARRIDDSLFWPLTELDLINYSRRENSFVASQSVTIFDNLANQTFTVINSLQLSQYNDHVSDSGESSNIGGSAISDFNLYACIVDADVRHNYATLGVRYIKTPRKVPILNPAFRPQQKSYLNQKYPSFDLFRQNQLRYDLNGLWISIDNASSADQDLVFSDFKLSSMMLSMVFLTLLGLLVTLIHLTLKSYRNLNQLEEQQIDMAFKSDGEQSRQLDDANLALLVSSANDASQSSALQECTCDLELKSRCLSDSTIKVGHDDGVTLCHVRSEMELNDNPPLNWTQAHSLWPQSTNGAHELSGSSRSTHLASESLNLISPDCILGMTSAHSTSCYLERKKSYLVENPICLKD